jgi:hypothetical protein
LPDRSGGRRSFLYHRVNFAASILPIGTHWLAVREPQYQGKTAVYSLLFFIHEYFSFYRILQIQEEEPNGTLGKSFPPKNGIKIPLNGYFFTYHIYRLLQPG